MSFAVGLRDSLRDRVSLAPGEFARGDSLEHVLGKCLLAVEDMSDGDLLTSILLLDPDGLRLWHGAAPNLPGSYCKAIDGIEIGPCVGSCGTAAFRGAPVYVADIETDPLWADYRDLAIAHGLRACWSTPIRDSANAIIGTFAIYHRSVGSPTRDELEAIDMITEHVAEAIVLARNSQDLEPPSARPNLRLVTTGPDSFSRMLERLSERADRLHSLAGDLERCGDRCDSEHTSQSFRTSATDCRRLGNALRKQIQKYTRSLPS